MSNLPGRWPAQEIRNAEYLEGFRVGKAGGKSAAIANRNPEPFRNGGVNLEGTYAGVRISEKPQDFVSGFRRGLVAGYNGARARHQPFA